MDRRSYLGLIGTAATGIAGKKLLGTDYSIALPRRYMDNSGFQEKLENIYEEPPEFEDERPNILVDVLPVGRNSLQPDLSTYIEQVHSDHGINLSVRERKESYPENTFLDDYGSDPRKVIDDFVNQNVSAEMQNAAVQTVLAPGRQQKPGKGLLGKAQYPYYLLGMANESIVMASDYGFFNRYEDDWKEAKLRAVMHELGHVYGLEHSQDEGDLMYRKTLLSTEPDFSPESWENIREKLG